jgi:hypothetical protein
MAVPLGPKYCLLAALPAVRFSELRCIAAGTACILNLSQQLRSLGSAPSISLSTVLMQQCLQRRRLT